VLRTVRACVACDAPEELAVASNRRWVLLLLLLRACIMAVQDVEAVASQQTVCCNADSIRRAAWAQQACGALGHQLRQSQDQGASDEAELLRADGQF